MKLIKDPAGNDLKAVLLQVVESDEQGPLVLRARRDHERIDLTNESDRVFNIAWMNTDTVLGEMRIADVVHDLEDVRAALAERDRQRIEIDRDLAYVHKRLGEMQEEIDHKTTALRQLQKERDPERIEALVRERTEKIEADLRAAKGEAALAREEAEKLRGDKKRLRAENDKLKLERENEKRMRDLARGR